MANAGDCNGAKLYAGQTIEVGCVTAEIVTDPVNAHDDPYPLGTYLKVTYDLIWPWKLTEVHIGYSLNNDEFDGMLTKTGNARPGKFQFGEEYEYYYYRKNPTYYIPIDLDGACEIYIAAHAVVWHCVDDEVETAWAGGGGGSYPYFEFLGSDWATYFMINACGGDPA